MDTPDRLTGRAPIPPGYLVRRESGDPDLYRELYEGVGAEYHWRDRRAWSDEQLRAQHQHQRQRQRQYPANRPSTQ